MRRKCRATKKINQEQMKFLRQKDNEIQQKAFRIKQLNSGIEYLKEHCNTAGNQSLGTQKNKMSSTGRSYICNFFSATVYGCKWSEWTDWSDCSKTCGSGGSKQRMREKLPGEGKIQILLCTRIQCHQPSKLGNNLGSCDGDSSQTTVCGDNIDCPLENDENSLVVVIGGETVASRENEVCELSKKQEQQASLVVQPRDMIICS